MVIRRNIGPARSRKELIMRSLHYIFVPTAYAQDHQHSFWDWMTDREVWFYSGLTMVARTDWWIEAHGPHPGSIHHLVEFSDDGALAAYRRALATRADDPAWERKRREQDRWYRIDTRLVLGALPVRMGISSAAPRQRQHRP